MARVLVVDDDADINTALRAGLRAAGYDAIGATTGAAALEEVARARTDLVLLDQMLPDIDGAEVCRRLRESPATERLPIVFVTARADENARIAGLARGADDYVVKPFSMQELLLRVAAVLRRALAAELPVTSSWVLQRDQLRVRSGFARLHLERGEWSECAEVSRSILDGCRDVLSPSERAEVYGWLERCARHLEDDANRAAWRDLRRMR